jgi:hypothetical protein
MNLREELVDATRVVQTPVDDEVELGSRPEIGGPGEQRSQVSFGVVQSGERLFPPVLVPMTLMLAVACDRSAETVTPVSVTNPTRGSLIRVVIASPKIC